ncbi:hypothetical protein RB195_003827 [Necator americanus]|uniref:LITAF domain-containing protein n=1 Tax=Necator americanus TaxID=51031 RepID=A0ABR1DRM9_NECAM
MISSVSTIDSPPAYEQAKIHSPRTTVNSPTATDAPPPYEDRRVFPGHLSFLPPIEELFVDAMIPSATTSDAPPTYEQAKVHTEHSSTQSNSNVPTAPPPYEGPRDNPTHLDFLPPVEVTSAPNCSHCSIVRVQPGAAQGEVSESTLVKCAECQRKSDERAECCQEIMVEACARIALEVCCALLLGGHHHS